MPKSEEEEKKLEEGLPLETSPYVKYSDIEDYKRKGYGTVGHAEVKKGHAGGSTDAPTPSGDAVNPKLIETVPRLEPGGGATNPPTPIDGGLDVDATEIIDPSTRPHVTTDND